MVRALHLAAHGRLSSFPNPRVGCVLVQNGEIVGEGWHERAGEPHAEMLALRAAGDRARGADCYVTLEPCSHHGRTPPCADALITAGVGRVIVAMQDPNPLVAGQGLARLRAAGIAVEVGLMEAAARELNRGFISRMQRGRPHLTLKLAASLDGRTAMASGESQWISSPESRADVHRLRAQAGAVLTSSETVLTDDPQLTVRLAVGAPRGRDESGAGLEPSRPWGAPTVARQPDRIVLDAQARVPGTARVWQAGARRLWLVGRSPHAVPDGVEILQIATTADGHLDLAAALSALGAAAVNEVLVECGPRLAGALLQARLVDELLMYLAPALLGDQARGLASLLGLDRLDQRVGLRYREVRAVGPDLRITAVPMEL